MQKFYALIAFLFNIYVTYAKRTCLFKRITTFVETIDVLYLHSLDCKIHINSIIKKVRESAFRYAHLYGQTPNGIQKHFVEFSPLKLFSSV